jgi:type IV secretory pathway TraG/TraD family ATPase VirD4
MKTDPYLIDPGQRIEIQGVNFPMEYLFRGALITGQPGSGKTRCILLPLLRSILQTTGTKDESKAGLVIADPKGEFEPLLNDLLRSVGREDDLVVLKPGCAYYNPLASPFYSPNEIVEKIIGFANNTNRNMTSQVRSDEAYWANALRSLLGAVVAAARTIHGELSYALLNETFRKIDKFQNASNASQWMRENNLSESTVEGIRDYLSLPEDKTRPCVTTSFTNTLQCWRNEPLRQLTTPTKSLPSIDPIDVIHRGKILLLACTDAAYGVSIAPLLVAIKEHLFSAVLARDKIEVVGDGTTWTPVNRTRPVFFIADEFQGYVTADASMGELVALDRMRSNRAGYIACTQNLASLHSVLGNSAHATRLISLFANQVFLSNICPATADQAEHICGKKKVKDLQRQKTRQMAPPLLFRKTRSSYRPVPGTIIEMTKEVPRVDSSTLAKMSTGEFWLRLADGSVHHKTTPFSAVRKKRGIKP